MSNALKSTGKEVRSGDGRAPPSLPLHPLAGGREEGESGDESRHLIITVSDSGPGIPRRSISPTSSTGSTVWMKLMQVKVLGSAWH